MNLTDDQINNFIHLFNDIEGYARRANYCDMNIHRIREYRDFMEHLIKQINEEIQKIENEIA